MSKFPDNPHQLALILYRELQDVKLLEGKRITGVVPSSWDMDDLEDALSTSYIFESVDTANRTVVFKYPPLFIDKFQELLDSFEYCKKLPEHFYLVPENYAYPDPSEPLIVTNYNKAMRLIHLLKTVADYLVPTHLPDTLVFVGKCKIEIELRFTSDQLRSLDDLNSFEAEYIYSDIHSEQKKKIIVTALTEMFKGQTKVDIGTVFLRFCDFYESIRHSYDMYVADFSYEKVKNEVVKEKVDSIIKINKVFSDIQNQLLAVPLAIVLVGGQLDKTGEFWVKNLLIWCGAFVFTVFMDLLIRNQRNSLKSVSEEVKQHEQQLRSKYHSIAEKFSTDFRQINRRITHQKVLLYIVDGVVALSLFGITIVALWFNDWLQFFLKPFNLA